MQDVVFKDCNGSYSSEYFLQSARILVYGAGLVFVSCKRYACTSYILVDDAADSVSGDAQRMQHVKINIFLFLCGEHKHPSLPASAAFHHQRSLSSIIR